LSGPPVARGDERPTHPTGRAAPKRGPFGLAPDGVCRAPGVATGAVSSCLAFSPLLPGRAAPVPEGGVFSVALSPGRPESPLATILP
jgi:hypothetical protein